MLRIGGEQSGEVESRFGKGCVTGALLGYPVSKAQKLIKADFM